MQGEGFQRGMDFNSRLLYNNQIPAFSKWKSEKYSFNRLDLEVEEFLEKKEGTEDDLWERAIDVSMHMAAVDTGAIENLYDVDRGFTFSVALQKSAWEEEINKREGDVRQFFEAQLLAYQLSMKAVAEDTLITEIWIRQLNEDICKPQDTYNVYVMDGDKIQTQKKRLPKGKYKSEPNHVRLKDGEYFSYAPVDMTAPEMDRLVKELRSDEFLKSNPILQAAYTHHDPCNHHRHCHYMSGVM